MSDSTRRVECPSCGAQMKAPPEAAGKKVRCSKCRAILTVPALPVLDEVQLERSSFARGQGELAEKETLAKPRSHFLTRYKWWFIGICGGFVALSVLGCAMCFGGGVLLWRGTETVRAEESARLTIEKREGVLLKKVFLSKRTDREWKGYYETFDGRQGNITVTGEGPNQLVEWERGPLLR